MNTREFLLKYRNAEYEIGEMSETLLRLRARATKCTAAYGSNGGGAQPNKDKLPAIIERIIEAEKKTEKRIEDLMSVQAEVEGAIAEVEDGRCKALLMMRYLNGKSFEEISVALGYSYHYVVHDLHTKALRAVKVPPKST
jgi:hypothetical protein